MNAVMERWVRTCRRELLDRTLIWNQAHLPHALREFESHYNQHRPHRTLRQCAPLRPVPETLTEQAQIIHLDGRRHDRLGGILHEYEYAARPARTNNRHPHALAAQAAAKGEPSNKNTHTHRSPWARSDGPWRL